MNPFTNLLNLSLTLEMILLSHKNFEKVSKSVLYVHLNESELLIALILEYLSKKCHFMVVLEVSLDTMDQS